MSVPQTVTNPLPPGQLLILILLSLTSCRLAEELHLSDSSKNTQYYLLLQLLLILLLVRVMLAMLHDDEDSPGKCNLIINTTGQADSINSGIIIIPGR